MPTPALPHPFPIQAMTLPVALSGHDMIGQAKTGTGKTLGFGIPALQRVIGPDDAGFALLPAPGAPQALVIVPTRELAVQVASDLQNAARKRNARITTIYGGRAYEPQVEALQNGVEVVVGTPGRLIDLYKQKHLVLKNVKMVILTRPTKCWTSASCPTSRPSSPARRPCARRCCSPPPCPARSSPWPAAT